ncbi:hypothetical protein HPB50_021918 [Hyalomma asiaticum]|uniref:Uncharacterized protein n=1 Tax=Hyalomma asiaticum TaxID=266040 RepID=A0ACB7SXB8_HYAAI|nr:hypothetical protein HPB50_021918 [Hyalomma asiaticum]
MYGICGGTLRIPTTHFRPLFHPSGRDEESASACTAFVSSRHRPRISTEEKQQQLRKRHRRSAGFECEAAIS